MSLSPRSTAAEENTKSPQVCDATPVNKGMLGGGGETLPSWRWMLPHVSLCVWCVPQLGAEMGGDNEGGSGNIVRAFFLLCVCHGEQGQVREAEQTINVLQRDMRVLFFISDSSSTDPHLTSFPPLP